MVLQALALVSELYVGVSVNLPPSLLHLMINNVGQPCDRNPSRLGETDVGAQDPSQAGKAETTA